MSWFCGNDSSLGEAWITDGLSPCLYETIVTGILFGIVFIFGGIEIIIYRKYSTQSQFIPKRSWLYILQLLLTVTLVIQSALRVTLHALLLQDKTVDGYLLVSGVLLSVAWLVSLALICLERKRLLPSIPTRGHGLVLLLLWTFAFGAENVALLSWESPLWWWKYRDYSKNVELGLWIVRYVSSLGLFLLGFKAPGLPSRNYSDLMLIDQRLDEENQPLVNEAGNDGAPRAEGRNFGASTEGTTWKGLFKKTLKLWPYMWPKNSPWLQLCVVICMLLLAAGRVVNLFTPIMYKHIVDSLTIQNGSTVSLVTELGQDKTMQIGQLQFRWDYILIYVCLRFLQGGGFGTMGLLNNSRSLLWIWVQQYTSRETGVGLFAHLHHLSLRWHLGRKTGEVLRVMDRGTSSINSLLSYIVFNIIPTIADIVIAVIYFLTAFSVWFAVIVCFTMVLYLIATIVVTEWRTKFRRDMNKLDNARNARGVDSLLNFETVKYYGAEQFEVSTYRDAVVKYQKAEWISSASLNLLNTVQNVIVNGGLLGGSLLCVWYVVEGKGLTVGDYVLFSTYIVQLYGPLNWFGTYYRMIQQSFIDMENMFELLEENQEVKDAIDAPPLNITKGMIEFNNVTFYYDPAKPILQNVSFIVPPGQTVALVGHSGAGKSTIIRLLFRFYDVQGGCIKFDGQDISQVTQTSLRQAIGVVPQDTVLFNNDILYNIKYGRVSADDDEVKESAKAADIHDRILTFPDAYDTLVGERGLKLSGGEKQRVAIARTLLKSPQFVLLDEATSALDTQTERNIQSSLAAVCENRTTIIVAHRLSTIIHADQILVLKEGEVVERGTHDELLSQEGMYFNMWEDQTTKAEDTDTDNSGSDNSGTESKDKIHAANGDHSSHG